MSNDFTPLDKPVEEMTDEEILNLKTTDGRLEERFSEEAKKSLSRPSGCGPRSVLAILALAFLAIGYVVIDQGWYDFQSYFGRPAPSGLQTTPPSAAPPTTAAATATPAPVSGRIAPATNVQVSTDRADGIIYVEWEYKEEWEVAPDYFEVLLDGQVVNTGYQYEGLDSEYGYGYSWGGLVGCGVSRQVEVLAVNGSDVARTEPIEGRTAPC